MTWKSTSWTGTRLVGGKVANNLYCSHNNMTFFFDSCGTLKTSLFRMGQNAFSFTMKRLVHPEQQKVISKQQLLTILKFITVV